MRRELLPPVGALLAFASIMVGGWYLWSSVIPEFGSARGALYILFAFLAGIASFFAPCAFALLPGYASYYLGVGELRRNSPAYLGVLTASGILLFYLLIGVLVYALGQAISPYLRYLKPAVGFAFLLLGAMLYSGYALPLPRAGISRQAEGAPAFFLFGFAYAATALGCTLPIFLALVIYPLFTGELILGFLAFVSYSLAKALLMVVVTYLVAYSREALIRRLAVSTAGIKKLSGIALVLLGAYLLYSGGMAF
jgi:cytochrome c-type biogenesis protein